MYVTPPWGFFALDPRLAAARVYDPRLDDLTLATSQSGSGTLARERSASGARSRYADSCNDDPAIASMLQPARRAPTWPAEACRFAWTPNRRDAGYEADFPPRWSAVSLYGSAVADNIDGCGYWRCSGFDVRTGAFRGRAPVSGSSSCVAPGTGPSAHRRADPRLDDFALTRSAICFGRRTHRAWITSGESGRIQSVRELLSRSCATVLVWHFDGASDLVGLRHASPRRWSRFNTPPTCSSLLLATKTVSCSLES